MSLNNITRHIILDVSVNKHIVVLVKQYDIEVREIIAKITDSGKPYMINSTIVPRIKCIKPDNKKVINDCIILPDGSIKIDITEQMTMCAGMCNCELLLVDASTNQVLHTMNFVLNVKKSVFSDDEIASANEFIALENALIKADNILAIADINRITENQIDLLFD